MSKATVEPALTSLIPTLNGPLPVELVELAVSLLARSRSVAHSLKPDEEIARPYACAQLACERLKKRLNLPTITPRPPCPPRIYRKLYQFLDSALPPTISRTSDSQRNSAAQTSQSTRTTPKTPLSNRKTPRSRAKDERDAQREPPGWIMPTVRELCKAFETPNAAPHIFAGIESIYPLLARMTAAAAAAAAAAPPETPSKRPRRTAAATKPPSSELSDAQVLGLIAIVLFYVVSRLSDEDITPAQFLQMRSLAVSTLLQAKAAAAVFEQEILAEIEKLMPMTQEEGWLDMEWFANISPEEASEEMEGVEMEGTPARKNAKIPSKIRPKRATLKESLASEYIGLGTMMQEATDYLGERQREDYSRWKEGIMRRIEEIEAS